MIRYLSRLELSKAPSIETLRHLLDPDDPGRRMDAHHRLLWSAFAAPGQARDFLWRAMGTGRFLTLSARPPEASDLFARCDTQPFAPDLRAGDRLAFTLRANATRTEKTGTGTATGKEKKRHIDLVMDALPPKGRRADARMAVAQSVGRTWMGKQGARGGFEVEEMAVGDYSTLTLAAAAGGPRSRQPRFGVLDMTGTLTVTEPETFLRRLADGFGRAKAFGCGLMLIRRA